MSNTPPLFEPSRLCLARRRRGWSRTETARRSHLTARSIIAYELGERVPSQESLVALAQALEYPIAFFQRSKVDSIREEGVSFRALSRMTATEREQALASGDLAMELSGWLDGEFDLPSPAIPDLHPQSTPEAAANALRIIWELGDRPIKHLVGLLESKGVRVFSLAENTLSLDGFSFWKKGRPYIFLNTLKSAERSRFDAAHELGHIVLHQHGLPSGRKAEQEANQFAAAFLMPRTSMFAFAPRNPTIAQLLEAKQPWGVAVTAYAHRMHEIGLLSEWYYRSLCIEMQSRGYRQAEPQAGTREMSQIWPKVFSIVLRKEGTTRQELASTLGWPLRELRALVFQLVLSAEDGGNTPTGEMPHEMVPERRLRLV